jgi:hypothetical protein
MKNSAILTELFYTSAKDISSLEKNELLESETKTILLIAPIIEGRTNTKLKTLEQDCRD